MGEYLVQDTSLTAVADAIRAKTGDSDPLAFPTGMVDAIAGISSGGSGGGDSAEGYTLKATVLNSDASRIPQFGGYWPGFKNADVDMNNYTLQHPNVCYFGTDKPGGTLVFRNLANDSLRGDMFRNANVFSSVSFLPKISPSSLNRFYYQHNNYSVVSGVTVTVPTLVTIKGLCLDNLTSTSNPFYSDLGVNAKTSFNVLWEGTLKNSVSFASAVKLTDESLARLIDCLADYSGSSSTYTLTLGTTLQGRLSADQIATATGKGWTLA